MELRHQTSGGNNVNTLALPVVARGSREQLVERAERRGYVWVAVWTMPEGGYYVHPETGNCLILTDTSDNLLVA